MKWLRKEAVMQVFQMNSNAIMLQQITESTIKSYKKKLIMIQKPDNLPQAVIEAPSIQSFEGNIDKLWRSHPIKLDYTAPPLSWKLSDTCTKSDMTMTINA